jgi:2-amino-4-hydroxy-6-hydroxymethyldihydropteridine diphosphokinase
MKSYLGLGSNLGNKENNIAEAIRRIDIQAGKVEKKSSLYYSEPWGFQSENTFVNVVISIETTLDPLGLLHVLQQIEKQMGRTTKSLSGSYCDRIIDIDILLYDDLKIDLPELKVPHPVMWERDFVTKPLKEILG